MKEKIALVSIVLIVSMLAMVITPAANAWVYWDTHLTGNPPVNSQEDVLVDYSGPHADRIQIKLFTNELAEFQALEAGQIDMTDWPIDKAHYTAWTQPPMDADIAVVKTGPEFGMYILDMQMNNNTNLPGPPPNENPAYTASFGNPMADVWLRRAIACVADRKQTVEQIVSGGEQPWLGEPMYTPLDTAYGAWKHPQIDPLMALAAYTYVLPDGSADVAKGNQYLDDHGYLPIVDGFRTKGGAPFTLEFYYRLDHTYRANFATQVMAPNLALLNLDVDMIGVVSAGARQKVMAEKRGHMYTGGWGLTADPDHLYYLFHINNYWHPGRPPNYMYYPGCATTFLAPWDDYYYCTQTYQYWYNITNFNANNPVGGQWMTSGGPRTITSWVAGNKAYDCDNSGTLSKGDKIDTDAGANLWFINNIQYDAPSHTYTLTVVDITTPLLHHICGYDLTWYGAEPLNFTDPDKSYPAGTELWENAQNYWSWEMMIATTYERALFCAYKSQEAIAYMVCGVPIWAAASFTSFHRRYTGGNNGVPKDPDDGENQYRAQPWKGVVNQKGFGVWSTMSFYDMHTANAAYGDGAHMTIRWGFRQPTMSLNPIYAEWVWDWYVLNQAYDSVIGLHSYTLADIPWLATNWEISTWDSADYGTCTKVRFNLRHDVKWSDGMPMTASDVKFTWGGPLMTGSLSNLLAKKGYPPAYWSSQVADILSIATPDPWTVIVYLDVYAYFGLHSMSGFNIVLPEHVWKPIINGGDPTQPWNQPCVVTGGYTIDSTQDPAPVGYIGLSKNPQHFHCSDTPKTDPINIATDPTFNVSDPGGNIGWIYPKLNQTGMTIDVKVTLCNKYYYETGPYKENVWPCTMLDGLKTVDLWIWNGVWCPNNPANYVFFRNIVTNQPFATWTCFDHQFQDIEDLNIANLPVWYYMVKVHILINTLEVSQNCVDWFPIGPLDNPWYGYTEDYSEWEIGTSRYDIGGGFFKPCDPLTPVYQPIPDMKVNVKDTYQAGKAFGSRPGYPNWDTAADVNGDYKVDVKDYYAISQNFGWVAPNPLGP